MSVDTARRVLQTEAEAIKALAERIGPEFEQALDLCLACEGKVIVIGIGKSGLVGRKIAATLASTGTPAFFVHPAEGVHGDLGMIAKSDLVLMLSNSGETEELANILPSLKRLGLPIVGMFGNKSSTLARAADVVLDAGVSEEACLLNLAPTSSTTAALAMGDALAIALLERRGFTKDDFAHLHPAGALGRKLLRVSDLMRSGESLPVVPADAPLKDVILEISSKMLGHAAVVGGGELLGVVSDGDLRRAMERDDFMDKTAAELMTRGGKSIGPRELAESALRLMERHKITALLVTEEEKGSRKLLGIVHLHDLLKAGIA